MANPYKRPESILLIVYTRCRQVLLLKRNDHPCFWQSVTGSMEWHEHSPLHTAGRELAEETGLQHGGRIQDLSIGYRYEILPQWQHRYAPGITENLEHVFALLLPQPVAITVSKQEHSCYQWLALAEAAAKATSWTNRDVILRLENSPVSHAGWLTAP